MIKKIILVVFALFFVFFAGKVWAVDLSLTRIGTMNITQQASIYTYSGESPDLSGLAVPGAGVQITVNSIVASVSAAISGVWLYHPTNIVEGSNMVYVESGNEAMSFNLNFTEVVATTSPTPTVLGTADELASAGSEDWIPLMIVAVGSGMLIYGRKLKDKVSDEWNL